MSVDVAPAPAPAPVVPPQHREAALRVWSTLWPKVLAAALAIGVWQVVVWTGWRPDYLLPGPGSVFSDLAGRLADSQFWGALATTMRRGVTGFALAVLLGSLLGIAVSQWRVLRMAVGSLITGLQTMPSIAWFPLAILLFQGGEGSILFVVVLGAAPSVANGIISGIDDVQPQLLRAGRMLGATGIDRYRYIVLPAAMPAYVSGLKQGWAFAWRSLLAGELLVVIANRPSLGADMQFARESVDAPGLLALMIVILVIGMVIDGMFSYLSRHLRERRGLTGA
jgi:NitT/TauT family transport system permease protein